MRAEPGRSARLPSEPDRDAVEDVVSGELGIRRGRAVAVREAVTAELHESVAAEQLRVARHPPREPGAPAETKRHRALAPSPGLARARRVAPRKEERGPERQVRGERAEGGGAGCRPPQLETERDRRAEQILVEEAIRSGAETGILGADHRLGPERRHPEPCG